MAPSAKPKPMIVNVNGVTSSTSCAKSTNIAPLTFEARFIKPRMIANERSRWLPHNQRTPSFSSARQDAAAPPCSRSGWWARNEPGISATSAAATKKEPASTKNGAENAASSSEPIGGPMNVLATDSMLHIRHERLPAVVAQHLGRAQQQRGQQQQQVQPGAGADDVAHLVGCGKAALLGQDGERDEQREDATEGVHQNHRPLAVDPVGDHSGGQREHQLWQPLGRRDQADQHRVASDRRCQPRVGDGSHTVADVGHRCRDVQLAIVAAEADAFTSHGRTLRKQRPSVKGHSGVGSILVARPPARNRSTAERHGMMAGCIGQRRSRDSYRLSTAGRIARASPRCRRSASQSPSGAWSPVSRW